MHGMIYAYRQIPQSQRSIIVAGVVRNPGLIASLAAWPETGGGLAFWIFTWDLPRGCNVYCDGVSSAKTPAPTLAVAAS